MKVKAPGVDSIPAEIYTCCDLYLIRKLSDELVHDPVHLGTSETPTGLQRCLNLPPLEVEVESKSLW